MTPGRRRNSTFRWVGHAYRAGLQRYTPRLFPFAQRLGVHVVANSFESPIPDTRQLDAAYQRGSDLVGIDLRVDEQVALAHELSRFRDEIVALPTEPTTDPQQFHFGNPRFDGMDACLLWCLVRRYQPARVVEVGSGMSTLLASQALRRNRDEGGKAGRVVAIEPFPRPDFQLGTLECVALLQEPAENLPLSTFTELEPDDILFIDSSHVLKTGSDVQYLYLEVLPRLPPGVLVHVHDIFLPWEYPREWVTSSRFWNEQYLLQAFLTYNRRFQVVWATTFMHGIDPALLRASFGV